jgi:hypothetical protein
MKTENSLQYAFRKVGLASSEKATETQQPKKKVARQYRYRNLPCSIRPDNQLWCVSGYDTKSGASGILEWCYDEIDANFVMNTMLTCGHFADLKAEKYAS